MEARTRINDTANCRISVWMRVRDDNSRPPEKADSPYFGIVSSRKMQVFV